ncbi:hypothetical protein [Methylomonas sp. HYX-M1]|uniref:hypothetical protein n=1 Tax=Methylomonas sp. HYX-M1 TaxID=3139307 RepID=UPI00345C2D2C
MSAALQQQARLVAVDGFQASGKTTIARALGVGLGRRVISADDYLHRHQGSFFVNLDIERLAADVQALDSCVLEGVCCLQVLEAIGETSDCLVYVKRMAKWGWAEEDELEKYAVQGVAHLSKPTEPLAISLRTLWDEVARYHIQFQPHVVATITYERSEA